MNPGALTGSNRPTGTYSPIGKGYSSGNRGRLSIDEIRLFGWPDNGLGQINQNTLVGGGGKMINTNPQTGVKSIFFPGDQGSVINVGAGTIITTSAPWSAAFNTAGTVLINQSATNNFAAFEANTTIQNYGSSALTLPGMSSVVGGNLYVANGATVTFGVSGFADITSNLAWAATNSGTFSVPTVYNYDARQTVLQSGVTITRRSAYHVTDSGTGGTLTTQVGLDIPALSGGTTNVGIWNLSTSIFDISASTSTTTAVTINGNSASSDQTHMTISGSNAASRSQFFVRNTAAVSTSNKATFGLSALTTVVARTTFQFDASFSNTTDASRTSTVNLQGADNGTFLSVLQFVGRQATFPGTVIYTNNAVTVTSNAGTVPITFRMNTFTNSSAANMTITMATSGATDGQLSEVRVYDFSAVAKTITWVNTENSTATATGTSNGSTTLPVTVLFQYNSQTSLWRCIASA